MIFITQCDSSTFWQTYLSDPASVTMEGILIFNKHLLFLLTIIVLFVAWVLFYTLYYFMGCKKKFRFKYICSKELEVFLTLVAPIASLALSVIGQPIPVRVGVKIFLKLIRKLKIPRNVPYFLNPGLKDEIEEAVRNRDPSISLWDELMESWRRDEAIARERARVIARERALEDFARRRSEEHARDYGHLIDLNQTSMEREGASIVNDLNLSAREAADLRASFGNNTHDGLNQALTQRIRETLRSPASNSSAAQPNNEASNASNVQANNGVVGNQNVEENSLFHLPSFFEDII